MVLLILLKGQIPDAARIVPLNALLWAGFALQWLAYARFDRPEASARVPLGVAGAISVGFAVFWLLGADYRERSLYASAAIATLALANAYQLMRDGGLRKERSRVIGVGLAAVAVACQAIRAPMLAALPSGEGALLSGSLEQSVAFFPGMVHVLGVGLGFLVMHVERNAGRAQAAASTDPLTGCANRRAFAVHVAEALAQSARKSEPVSVVLLDIDRFKSVNDTYGHAAGDAVIRHVADVLRDGVRTSDIVARLGGEEFCVLLPGADARFAESLATRLRVGLQEPAAHADHAGLRVTASFGVAQARPNEAWDALFARADRALYEAKGAGRDCVAVA